MQPADILTLPPAEQAKIEIITLVIKKRLTQKAAARLLSLSERHIRRLVRRYEAHGATGVCNQRLGKPASNKIDEQVKEKALSIIHQHFYDYGPTLASEKLNEYFDIQVSKETIRQWMITQGLWQAKQKKVSKPHPPRARRPYLGELIQVDGSYHGWLEERGPKCCLLVYIDDATGRLMKLKFTKAETTLDYLDTFKDYVVNHGVPKALYFDKHNVFHINQSTSQAKNGLTQFGRVLKKLDVIAIYAHSPQAKGRVERMNETLQDRLIKELRFHDISTMEEANVFLDYFVNKFNQRFEKLAPGGALDVHRTLRESEHHHLAYTFSIQKTKTINKNLLVKHNKVVYQIITPPNRTRQWIGRKITMCENLEGVQFYFEAQKLDYKIIQSPASPGPTLNRKVLDQYMDRYFEEEQYWSVAP